MNILRHSKFKSRIFLILTLSLLGCVIYSNTFQSEFHFDDYEFIVGNPGIRNVNDLHAVAYELGGE